VELGAREKRRLLQLGVCLVLFFTLFLAKGTGRLSELRAQLRAAIGADTDFEAAFADLGWAVAARRPLGETVNELWSDIFIPEEKAPPDMVRSGPVYAAALVSLDQANGVLAVGAHSVATSVTPMEKSAAGTAPGPVPTAEPAVVHMDYTGPALPENTTMDKYALGLTETVSPVRGSLTSDFGWREHPIEGGEKFHYGVDLGVPEGTAVAAFAAGTVDYIGESDIYGLYLQLDHGNGVKSFYAHCSELCVQQGKRVAVGEKVAESGATGNVTGPHLHFELKKDGMRLEPLYYIETVQ